MTKSAKEPRITLQTLKVLAFFLEKHPAPVSGADVFNKTKMFSGTLYPILGRLESAGWLTATWEEINPSEAGRPRRRLYNLTALGQRKAVRELANVPAAPLTPKPATLGWRPS